MIVIFCYGLVLLCIVGGLLDIKIYFTKKSLFYLLIGLIELYAGFTMQYSAMGL